jgi:uncharacterized membrane protein YhaH (DUF805 family)
MAFSDDSNGVWASVRYSFRNTFNFVGRSQRTDVGYFLIAAWLMGRIAGLALSTIFGLDPEPAILAILAIGQWVFFLPFFALLGRRLQDFGITAWWTFFVAIPILANSFIIVLEFDLKQLSPLLSISISILGVISLLIILAAIFWPGDEGQNEFGPNPRLDTV